MQLIKRNIFKFSVLLIFLISISYLFYLNSLIKNEFSKEIKQNQSVIQIQYSLDDYPKDLINMLLLVEDQSFFNHNGVDFKEILRSGFWLDFLYKDN